MRKNLLVVGAALAVALSAPVSAAKEQLLVAWRDSVPTEMKALKAAADAFTRKYGITVKILPFAWGDGDDKIITMFATGLAPDVFSNMYRSGFVDYARRGMLADLTPFIKRDKLDMGAFYSQTYKHLKIDGRFYGLPYNGGVWNSYYNPQLLLEAGIKPPPANWNDKDWTWDRMVTDAVKLTKDTNGDGRIEQYGLNLRFWPMNVYAWLWGGDFFPESIYDRGVALKSTVTSAAAVTGIEKLVELTTKYKVLGGDFKLGKTAMMVDGSWEMVNFSIAKPQLKMGVAVTPRGSVARRPVVFTDPWMVAKTSKHKEAAWKWLKFTTVEEGADILAATDSLASFSRRGLAEYLKRFKNLDDFHEVFDGALSLGQESPNHTVANFGEILLAIETEVGKAQSGKMSAATALKGLEPKLNAILARTSSHFSK